MKIKLDEVMKVQDAFNNSMQIDKKLTNTIVFYMIFILFSLIYSFIEIKYLSTSYFYDIIFVLSLITILMLQYFKKNLKVQFIKYNIEYFQNLFHNNQYRAYRFAFFLEEMSIINLNKQNYNSGCKSTNRVKVPWFLDIA